MKQETKEIIDWIKNRLKMRLLDVKENQSQSNYEEYKKNYDEVINFLNSLPEIESHLCLGGYIQDDFGTPCCHGDKVRFQYDEGFYNGTLTFNFTFKCFTIVNENGVFFWINNAIKWFEKVEK